MPDSKARLSADIRRTFLQFFAGREHEIVPSSSLVPANDPTLLFTNAGMNQFKDVFTGQAKRARSRATSSQKCVRAGGKHNDLDNVGRTARHHTFFEMLGNFSFGDYFKQDAITFAHELLTRDYAIDPKRLVYTVHHTDDEARALWRKIAGVGDDRVISLGDKDNFWQMGETGPCGPCSEIHYHQGDDLPCAEVQAGRPCQGPACDCDRWVEIWNLVFMQYERFADGTRRPLPRPSVDTGMGLERLCAVLQGVRSNYETDLLRPLIDEAARLAGKPFVPGDYSGPSVSMRAMADHARAAAFLIADGVFPEKTEREYTLRRIMRRAIYHAWMLGVGPFLSDMAGKVIDLMGGVYSDLVDRRETILKVCEQEETRFRETLERGMRILEDELGKLKSSKQLPGEIAFRLYDTYGFPRDLTVVIAGGRGFSVDDEGYDKALAEQQRRSEFQGSGELAVEAVWKQIAEKVPAPRFLGYEITRARGRITALLAEGAEADKVGPMSKQVAVIVDATPFYGEQGGQMGDMGELRGPHGRMTVLDARKPAGLTVHAGEVKEGLLQVGDEVELIVDEQRRDAIRRNHSATHLLHWALRTVLGKHVSQKGSLVAPDRLRFDFSHTAPLTPEERRRVEDLVNERVVANAEATTRELPVAEAKAEGAMAFFGEKYGDSVRVVSMAESKELCGGTHVRRTGDIGMFKLTEETGIAQGVRRIEAVTGLGAVAHVRRMEGELEQAGDQLRCGLFEVATKVGKLQEQVRDRERDIDKLKKQIATGGAGGEEEGKPEPVTGGFFVRRKVPVADPKVLRELGDQLRDKHKNQPTIVLIAGVEGDKVSFATVSTAPNVFPAGKLLGDAAKAVGARGGGRPDMAQGGGTSADQAEKIFGEFRKLLEKA